MSTCCPGSPGFPCSVPHVGLPKHPIINTFTPSTPNPKEIMTSEQSSPHRGPHRELPDEKSLAEAGEVMIKDKDGGQIPLKSLWTDKAQNERQLIVFVRHFFCGVCLRRVLSSISSSSSSSSLSSQTALNPTDLPSELQNVCRGSWTGSFPVNTLGSQCPAHHHRLRRARLHRKVCRGDQMSLSHLRRPRPADLQDPGHDVQLGAKYGSARLHQSRLLAERCPLDVEWSHVWPSAVCWAVCPKWRRVAISGRGVEVVPSNAKLNRSHRSKRSEDRTWDQGMTLLNTISMIKIITASTLRKLPE